MSAWCAQLCASLKVLACVISLCMAWYGSASCIYVCIFSNFELLWFDLFMCMHALNIHATYIACVRVFFNAIHISVCCCDNVAESSDLINCLSFLVVLRVCLRHERNELCYKCKGFCFNKDEVGCNCPIQWFAQRRQGD